MEKEPVVLTPAWGAHIEDRIGQIEQDLYDEDDGLFAQIHEMHHEQRLQSRKLNGIFWTALIGTATIVGMAVQIFLLAAHMPL